MTALDAASHVSARRTCTHPGGDSLAHRLVHARLDAGLTQFALLAKLGWKSQARLSRIERGQDLIRLPMLERWAALLGRRVELVDTDGETYHYEPCHCELLNALAGLLAGWGDRQRADTYTAETAEGPTGGAAAERVRIRGELIDELTTLVAAWTPPHTPAPEASAALAAPTPKETP